MGFYTVAPGRPVYDIGCPLFEKSTIDLGGGKKDKDESSDEGGSGKGKQVIIHKLLVPVDLKKIKDLQQLLALLQEVEDYAAANEDGEPGDDEDAVPAPA